MSYWHVIVKHMFSGLHENVRPYAKSCWRIIRLANISIRDWTQSRYVRSFTWALSRTFFFILAQHAALAFTWRLHLICQLQILHGDWELKHTQDTWWASRPFSWKRCWPLPSHTIDRVHMIKLWVAMETAGIEKIIRHFLNGQTDT